MNKRARGKPQAQSSSSARDPHDPYSGEQHERADDEHAQRIGCQEDDEEDEDAIGSCRIDRTKARRRV
jgi:hypothetical protein